jgi:cytochrome c
MRGGTRIVAVLAAAAVLVLVAILWRPHAKPAPVEPPMAAVPSAELARAEVNPASMAYYEQKVKPIFVANCYRCHGGMNHKGGLSIATMAGMLKGGHDGSVLVPGHPEDSMLIKLIRHEGPKNDPMPMPPSPRPKISDADIATVTAWVAAGAPMTAPEQ